MAIGSAEEVAGSAAQLGVNVAGMLVAGCLVLWLLRLIWRRLGWEQRARITGRVS